MQLEIPLNSFMSLIGIISDGRDHLATTHIPSQHATSVLCSHIFVTTQSHTIHTIDMARCCRSTNDRQTDESEAPLATLSEVFSFAETTRVKLLMVAGCISAALGGLCVPGKRVFDPSSMLCIHTCSCSRIYSPSTTRSHGVGIFRFVHKDYSLAC